MRENTNVYFYRATKTLDLNTLMLKLAYPVIFTDFQGPNKLNTQKSHYLLEFLFENLSTEKYPNICHFQKKI